MIRRLRFLAGVFALLALSLSLAGATWAALCTPGMDTRSSTRALVMPAHSSDGAGSMPLDDCRGAGSVPVSGQSSPPAPHCPFTSMAGFPCSAAASLPSTLSLNLLPAPEGATGSSAADLEPHLLLGKALFHPPKA
ncbi:MAG: hypothetical protein HY561_03240 [Gemmatimonadetes bacterium]|nr:hypothetical protein [Gemmatimonadota bacterium]